MFGPFDDMTLDAVGQKHGTDKASHHHDYLRKYQYFLQPWVADEFTLLELGVWQGASLRMWREYFPKARVIGVDRHEPATRAGEKRFDNIDVIIGDLSQADFVKSLCSLVPRLIVDDASHLWRHQLLAFFELFPHVESGGLYILEDISTSFEPGVAHHKRDETVNPFEMMQIIADYVTSNVYYTGERSRPLTAVTHYGEYQIEAIANMIDCLAFIQGSCLAVRK